jgi:hypothetical protein
MELPFGHLQVRSKSERGFRERTHRSVINAGDVTFDRRQVQTLHPQVTTGKPVIAYLAII